MRLLSYQVLDPYPSRIDGEINGFAWGLEVNNGVSERERELLLCFECAEVRKRGAGWFIFLFLLLEKKGKGIYIPLGPNGHLNRRWPLGRKRKRYIYP